MRVERVTGIGGLFFRARDPEALAEWYRKYLGIAVAPANYDEPPCAQEAGPTVFAPFPENGDDKNVWVINFRVRDLDAITEQLGAAGITVELDPGRYPGGRFARLYDPEGNPIELSQPEGPKAADR
jgi:predicted enzyme related to lactoylglutathione lyase